MQLQSARDLPYDGKVLGRDSFISRQSFQSIPLYDETVEPRRHFPFEAMERVSKTNNNNNNNNNKRT